MKDIKNLNSLSFEEIFPSNTQPIVPQIPVISTPKKKNPQSLLIPLKKDSRYTENKELHAPSTSYFSKCKDKIGYPYLAVANQAAYELNNKDFNSSLQKLSIINSYLCKFCHRFHVGHFNVKTEKAFYAIYSLLENNRE